MKTVRRSFLARSAVAAVLLGVACSAHAGIAERAQRMRVAGIDVIVYPMDVKDVVSVTGNMPLGDAAAESKRANPAAPTLVAALLEQGTHKRDKLAIANALSGIGAMVQWQAQPEQLGFYARSLKKDFAGVVGILAEELREPAFSAEEFAKAKTQLDAQEQLKQDDPGARAGEALATAVFPAESPHAPVASERMRAAIASVTVEDVKAFYRKNYGPAQMTIVVTGDIDVKTARAAIERAFAGWSGGREYARATHARATVPNYEQAITLTDKASVSVLWGQATGLRFADPDFLPLDIAANVLGSGFTGRLMSSVRVKEGLTYGIGADLFGSDVTDGGFLVQATFAPELLDKGVASTRREVERWWKDGVTAEELAARKDSLIGNQRLALGSTYGMGQALLATIVRGLDPRWLDAYPERVRAVTLDQVNGAIRKYVDPQKLVMVKAGTFAEPAR